MIPFTLTELISVANSEYQTLDIYHRELMKWAAMRIIHLEKELDKQRETEKK